MPCATVVIGNQPDKHSFPATLCLRSSCHHWLTMASDRERCHGAEEKNGAP